MVRQLTTERLLDVCWLGIPKSNLIRNTLCDNFLTTNNGNPYQDYFFERWSDYIVCKAVCSAYPEDNIYTLSQA